jgi:hypothetical protein
MEFKAIKSQLVENPINAGSTKNQFNFPTQNYLRLKQIVSIEVLSTADITVCPSGNDVISSAILKQSFLTIYGDNPEAPNAQGQWIEQIPLVSLHRLNNGTDPFVFGLFNMIPRNIVWEKSFITIFGTFTPPSNNTSFVLNVGYMGNEGDN